MARGWKDQSIHQKNDASSIGNTRRKARKAKTNSNKRDRQFLRHELEQRCKEIGPDTTPEYELWHFWED